jgi:hypothetical protein
MSRGKGELREARYWEEEEEEESEGATGEEGFDRDPMGRLRAWGMERAFAVSPARSKGREREGSRRIADDYLDGECDEMGVGRQVWRKAELR